MSRRIKVIVKSLFPLVNASPTASSPRLRKWREANAAVSETSGVDVPRSTLDRMFAASGIFAPDPRREGHFPSSLENKIKWRAHSVGVPSVDRSDHTRSQAPTRQRYAERPVSMGDILGQGISSSPLATPLRAPSPEALFARRLLTHVFLYIRSSRSLALSVVSIVFFETRCFFLFRSYSFFFLWNILFLRLVCDSRWL